jgi:hypothetical protein
MNDEDRQKPPHEQKPTAGALYVDHVSHFVKDLDAAAGVWQSLGLKVTPTSVQEVAGKPAGSSNRCVMLAEGYIEILSPTHATPVAKRMRALMKRYAGVHLVCFGTPDAAAEHQRLAAHGFEPQPLVDLQRAVDGGSARFKVVRLAPKKMPEGRIQYVEHLTPEHLWRDADVNHLSLKEIFVVATHPAKVAARWAQFAALIPRPEMNGVRLETQRGSIFFGTRAAIRKILGEAPKAPAIAGYGLGCSHPKEFAARCKSAGFAVEKRGARYRAKLPAFLGGSILFG